MTGAQTPAASATPEVSGLVRPIGVFDSGVGGLSVVRHLQQQLPHEDLIYLADQAHIPYGPRPTAEITAFSEAITRFLLAQGAKAIVVACNTATAAAIDALRAEFPGTPFIGMEPALKPAAAQTQTGKIGVLATPGTFASPRYALLLDRFAREVQVYEDPCVGLVAAIESGELDAPATKAILQAATGPMLAAGVDTLVLGCTHYPFILPLLRAVVGQDIRIIDPAPAVARRTADVLQHHELSTPPPHSGLLTCYTSGDPQRFVEIERVLQIPICPAIGAVWSAGDLSIRSARALHPS